MPLVIGFHGQVYDSNVPLYVELGSNRVVNRLNHKILDEAALKAQMTAEHWTSPAGEIGASAKWLEANDGPWSNWGAGGPAAPTAPDIVQPTNLPITGDAGGTKTTDIDLDFHGQNLTANATATVTYDIGNGDETVTAALTTGMTPVHATTAIATAISSVTGLDAKRTGTQITVTPADAVVLSKLTVAIA